MSRRCPVAPVRRMAAPFVTTVLAGLAAAYGAGASLGPCGQPGVQAYAPGARHIVECVEIAAGDWRWVVVATCDPNERCVAGGTGAQCTAGAP